MILCPSFSKRALFQGPCPEETNSTAWHTPAQPAHIPTQPTRKVLPCQLLLWTHPCLPNPSSVRAFPIVPKLVVLWHEVAHLAVLPSLGDLFQQILLAEAVSIQNAAPKQELPPSEHLLTDRKETKERPSAHQH